MFMTKGTNKKRDEQQISTFICVACLFIIAERIVCFCRSPTISLSMGFANRTCLRGELKIHALPPTQPFFIPDFELK
jgi:hypothetical protein